VFQIAAIAFMGGVLEALFLVTVTRSAFAVTSESDRVEVVAGRHLSVGQALLVGLLLVVARTLLAVLAAWQAARLSTRAVAELRHRLTHAYLRATWAGQQEIKAGGLQELISSYSGRASTMTSAVGQAVVAAANLLAMVILAIAVDPLSALVLVVAVTLLGGLLRPLRALIRRRSRIASRMGMDLATSVNEVSQLGAELFVFNVQEQAATRVTDLVDKGRRAVFAVQFAASAATPVYIGIAYFVLVGALGLAYTSDSTSLTSLGASLLVMLRSLSYGQALQASSVQISANTAAIDDLSGEVNRLEAACRNDGTEPLSAVRTVQVAAVSFEYTPGHPVLSDVSLEIRPNEVIGLIGPSGAGKTTLVELLLGLREPARGGVLVNGRPASVYLRDDWVRRVSFVPQTPKLISGTIADNIGFMRPGVSLAQIEEAARLAGLAADIEAFPEGYERMLIADGTRLSGGQMQRLCIARALVGRPDLLIMDEPTSALDVRSEQLVRDTIDGLRSTASVVIIAHRLSTLDICDRIMVLQDGRIAAFDTPERLEADSEFYREALILSGLRQA